MVEKLSIQIALDGGAEIERQLADIGSAGQKAFADITTSAEQVGGFKQLKPDEVTAKLQEMGVTGVDAIDKIQAAVRKAGRLETLVQGIQTAESALKAMALAAIPVGAAIATAMTAAAKATIAFAGEVNKINDQAIKLGKGVEQVDKFRAGLERAGVSAKSVGEILGSKLASEQGITGLEAFIRQLERMPDSMERSKAATQAFGAAGAELIRILQTGSNLTGFKVGGLISAEDANKAAELDAAINRLESSFNRLSTISFAPALTAGINLVSGAVQALGARMESIPWSTLLSAANLGLNPVASAVNSLISLFGGVSSAVQQVGIETEKASGLFTQWGTAAQQGGQQAAGAAKEAATAFTSFGTTVTQAGQTAASAGQTAASGWDVFLAKLQQIALAAGKILGGGGGGGGGGGVPGKASGGLLGGRGTGTSDSNLAWLSRGEYIMPARAVRQPGVLGFLEAMRRSGRIPGFAAGGPVGTSPDLLGSTAQTLRSVFAMLGDAVDGMNKAMDPLHNSLSKVMDGLGRSLRDAFDQTKQGIGQIESALGSSMNAVAETIARAMESLSTLIQSVEQQAKSATGKARGGLLGGRGTGTSDSNLAWVSRGEHIMPARAVRQPGVLEFLELLRRSGGNLRAVMDSMGRFALGGMVSRAIPAFATGGLAGGMSNVTIQFPGLPAISGLRASSDVVEQLHKAAALAQVRSGGRKPSWYT